MFSRITGTGSFLPGPPVSNDDLVRRGIETNDDWIVPVAPAFGCRHLADNGETSSDLGLEASRRALNAAGLEASDLDLIIVATSTPDFIFPSTACLLQANSGIMELRRLTCRRFAAASSTRWRLPTSSSVRGVIKRALVVGAEVFSHILDWNDRATCVLFGDGAGAVVLEASDRRESWQPPCTPTVRTTASCRCRVVSAAVG
jgi:3-oxoacyl-[acyl-carrier-protein] synthase-3